MQHDVISFSFPSGWEKLDPVVWAEKLLSGCDNAQACQSQAVKDTPQ